MWQWWNRDVDGWVQRERCPTASRSLARTRSLRRWRLLSWWYPSESAHSLFISLIKGRGKDSTLHEDNPYWIVDWSSIGTRDNKVTTSFRDVGAPTSCIQDTPSNTTDWSSAKTEIIKALLHLLVGCSVKVKRFPHSKQHAITVGERSKEGAHKVVDALICPQADQLSLRSVGNDSPVDWSSHGEAKIRRECICIWEWNRATQASTCVTSMHGKF